jgi:hypothetical protein
MVTPGRGVNGVMIDEDPIPGRRYRVFVDHYADPAV